jgi:hypothetical protein
VREQGFDLATGARRAVMMAVAVFMVCLVLVIVESMLGIGLYWRLALNQIPASITSLAVLRWSEPKP